MENYQREFIQFIAERQALKFGEFKTKSGRLSPYFFNMGGLYTGKDLVRLGHFYAQALLNQLGKGIDVVYGPAYKGIPLSAAITSQLYQSFQLETSYCFNRKEAKDHGEKGLLVGKELVAEDRLVIVDDVMTAGTSVRETMSILEPYQGIKILGVFVALDRQERGQSSGLSAMNEIQNSFNIRTFSIVTFEHIVTMAEEGALPMVSKDILERMKDYQERYRAAS